ncbi:hypothetical protein EW146_g2972 [Bondarzewia mesenterica]|uniref:Uncharacterized protein n=1 Tax=Bondarzewia mesenterica TaxID=1095465 RepID=A0A4S4LZ03_9AGAM|nr:hypothetical protein EW146_g2972 [Bondarzewia mesenterica]
MSAVPVTGSSFSSSSAPLSVDARISLFKVTLDRVLDTPGTTPEVRESLKLELDAIIKAAETAHENWSRSDPPNDETPLSAYHSATCSPFLSSPSSTASSLDLNYSSAGSSKGSDTSASTYALSYASPFSADYSATCSSASSSPSSAAPNIDLTQSPAGSLTGSDISTSAHWPTPAYAPLMSSNTQRYFGKNLALANDANVAVATTFTPKTRFTNIAPGKENITSVSAASTTGWTYPRPCTATITNSSQAGPSSPSFPRQTLKRTSERSTDWALALNDTRFLQSLFVRREETTVRCAWLDANGPCQREFANNGKAARQHIEAFHGGKPQKATPAMIECKWEGCKEHVQWGSLAKHFDRLVHLAGRSGVCALCSLPIVRDESIARHIKGGCKVAKAEDVALKRLEQLNIPLPVYTMNESSASSETRPAKKRKTI